MLLFIFYTTVLLRYNSYNTPSTHVKCTTQWFLVIHKAMQPLPQSTLEHFITSERNPYPLTSLSISLQPPSPRQPLLIFYLYRCAYSGSFICMESYNMWPFVAGFFHSVLCFPGSSMLQHLSILYSFLLLDNISLYGVQKRVNIASPRKSCLQGQPLAGIWDLNLGRFPPYPN